MARVTRHRKLSTERTTIKLSFQARRILVHLANERSKATGRRVPLVAVIEEALRLLFAQGDTP